MAFLFKETSAGKLNFYIMFLLFTVIPFRYWISFLFLPYP